MTRSIRPGRVGCKRLVMMTVLTGFPACVSEPPVTTMSAETEAAESKWEDLFQGGPVPLRLPPDAPPLLRIGQIVQLAGHLIVPDGRSRKVLVFDDDGTLVRQLPDSASQFPLSVLSVVAVGASGELLVYDADGRWVTRLAPHTFHVLDRVQISESVTAMVALSDGSVVTYFPGPEEMVHRFDAFGQLLASALDVGDPALRVFHSRVQTGGVAQVGDGSIFVVHPFAFELTRLSQDLRVMEVIRPAPNDPWAPDPPPFPEDLNPNGYDQAHEEWWTRFVHIGRPYGVGDDKILVTLFRSVGLSPSESFANLYRTDGRVVARGLRVPHVAQVVGSAGTTVFLVRNARLGSTDELHPLKFYRYRLREP